MKHITFNSNLDLIDTAILIKESHLQRNQIHKYYIEPIEKQVPASSMCAFSLKYDTPKKVKVSTIKDYLNTLLKSLNHLKVKTIVVADSNYFKVLTKERKAEPHYGYVKQCKIEGFEHFEVILVPNYYALMYNPTLQTRMDISLNTLVQLKTSTVKVLGSDIIEFEHYPKTVKDIRESLLNLMKYPALTCDIETTSLRFDKGKIATISFAVDKNNGIAFPVHSMYGVDEASILNMLREFFQHYKGRLWFHNTLFDVKFIIYHLFMQNSLDYPGMLKGLEVFRNVHDTQLLTYLALNSTAEIKLGLKENAFEFAGNYAEENINDVTKIPLDDLLRYNLIDTLSTWYVHDKYLPVVAAEKQDIPYETILQPSIKTLLKMMLVGLPMDLDKVKEAKLELTSIRNKAAANLYSIQDIKDYEWFLRAKEAEKANAKLKKKCHLPRAFEDKISFNPGSPKQLQGLLYNKWGYEPIDFTETKEPATGAKTLGKLLAVAKSDEHKKVLEALIEISKVDIILNNFIKNFETLAFTRDDGTVWLNGNLKLGGTQSGRLSSSEPNMQNIPSNSTYAKLIKKCFIAPKGWLFCGSDFAALEDRIGAILSGDKMKTKEFSENADGHSLRAIAFFSKLTEPVTIKNTVIDPAVVSKYDIEDVKSINQFKKDHGDIRQEAKAPSFALQYGGTHKTLHTNIGIPINIAKAIETGYHELYSGLAAFSEKNTQFAAENGYMECAFGLRLRTPILAKCLYGAKMPYEAIAEGRSSSNAKTQSWGQLINRAANATEERLDKSPHTLDIFAMNTIHDAAYYLVKADPVVIKWLNDNLIEEMNWNDHPLIKSKDVPLLANLDIGKSWDKQLELPNNASVEEIREIMIDNGLLESEEEKLAA